MLTCSAASLVFFQWNNLIYSKVVSRLCMISSCNTTTSFICLFLSLWAINMMAGEDQSQADQLNTLAEGPPL